MDKKLANHGFTLVELLISLGLITIVLGVCMSIYWVLQNEWERTTASNATAGDYSIVLSRISREIRAAQSPNYSTTSVNVIDDQNLDIYSFAEDTGTYTRIHYRYDDGDLKRGSVSTSDKFASSNPLFGTISNWNTVLDDIEDIPMFVNLSNIVVSDDTSITRINRSIIQLHLKTASMDNLSTFTSRYQSAPMTAEEIAEIEVQVKGIALNKSSSSIAITGTVILTATITPTNATNKNVAWTSSDPEVASVSQSGEVVGINAGTTTITATAVDGGRSATCTVTVNPALNNVPVTRVSLDRSFIFLKVGTSEQLTATIFPTNATNKAVTWTSSKPENVSVIGGVVTAVEYSYTPVTITVETVDGKFEDTCIVITYY